MKRHKQERNRPNAAALGLVPKVAAQPGGKVDTDKPSVGYFLYKVHRMLLVKEILNRRFDLSPMENIKCYI